IRNVRSDQSRAAGHQRPFVRHGLTSFRKKGSQVINAASRAAGEIRNHSRTSRTARGTSSSGTRWHNIRSEYTPLTIVPATPTVTTPRPFAAKNKAQRQRDHAKANPEKNPAKRIDGTGKCFVIEERDDGRRACERRDDARAGQQQADLRLLVHQTIAFIVIV